MKNLKKELEHLCIFSEFEKSWIMDKIDEKNEL